MALPGVDDGPAALVKCWVRRYRCTVCGLPCSVLPEGVVMHFLYSLASIIAAWFGITAPPIGQGLDHDAVYARQGVERVRVERHRSGKRRWRALMVPGSGCMGAGQARPGLNRLDVRYDGEGGSISKIRMLLAHDELLSLSSSWSPNVLRGRAMVDLPPPRPPFLDVDLDPIGLDDAIEAVRAALAPLLGASG